MVYLFVILRLNAALQGFANVSTVVSTHLCLGLFPVTDSFLGLEFQKMEILG